MKKFTNKSLLALSISAIMTTALLSACGSDSDNNTKDPDVVNPDKPNPSEQNLEVKAFADNADFTPVALATWQPSPLLPSEPNKSDESVTAMSVQNGQVVATTHWHNSIINIDSNQSGQAPVTPQFFAALLTAEHGVDSAADDIVSGASEHLLSDVEYSTDKQFMYALVKPPRDSAVAGDDTYGLFKVTLNEDGSIPTQTTTSAASPIAHRGSHVKRVADAKFAAMLPLDNGSLLVLDETNHAIRYYDSNFTLQEASSFALAQNDTLEAWSADEQAVYLLLTNEDGDSKKQRIEKRLLSTPTTLASSHHLAAEANIQAIESSGTEVIAIGEKSVYLLDANLSLLAQTDLSTKVEASSISTDFKRVALFDDTGALTLVDINSDNKSLSIPIAVSLDKVKSFGAFALADANHLFFNSDSGEISRLDLDQPMVSLTDQQVVAHSLATLKPELFNHGYPSSVVRYDLELPTQDPNLPINYTWESSDPSIISSEGHVTAPTDGQPVTVTLTATGNLSDGKISAQRQFELTVLPTAQVVTTSVKTDLSDALPKDKRGRLPFFNYNGQFSSNTANSDGSLYALFDDDGLMLLQKQSNDSLNAVMSKDNQLIVPKVSGLSFDEAHIRKVMWQGRDTLWVVLGDDNSGALIKKQFTQLNDTAALTEQVHDEWEVVQAYQKPVVGGLSNNNNTHITVITSDGTEQAEHYQVTTYNAATNQVVAQYGTDRNFGKDYVTIDDSGKYVFVATRNKATGGGTFSRYIQGQLSGEFEVDEPYHSGVITDEGNFIGSGRYGHLLFVKNALAAAPITAAHSKKLSFGRENYNGTEYLKEVDHHKGRIYSLARVGNSLFVGYRGIGASIIDISDFETPVETKFIPFAEQYLVIPSLDGQYVMQVGDRNGEFRLTSLK